MAASTGVAQVILALIYISAARSTVPSEYGLAIAAIAIGTSVVGFLDFGSNSYWIRELARDALSTEVLSRRVTTKLLLAATFASIWTVIVLVFDAESLIWMSGPITIAVLANQTLQVPLRALARSDMVALTVLADKSVVAVVFFGSVATGVSAVDSLWISLTVGSLIAALLAWSMTPGSHRPSFRFSVQTNPWLGTKDYGASTLAVSAQSFDLPILALVGGPFAAGMYGAVNRWTQPMGLLSGAFVSASLPFVARASSLRSGIKVIRRGLWLPAVAALSCAVIVVVAPVIVPMLLGDAYAGSSKVLQTLAIATTLSVFNQPLVVFLQARGFDKSMAWLMSLSVGLQLGLVVLLGTVYGAVGAALAILILQVILLVGSSTITVIAWRRGA